MVGGSDSAIQEEKRREFAQSIEKFNVLTALQLRRASNNVELIPSPTKEQQQPPPPVQERYQSRTFRTALYHRQKDFEPSSSRGIPNLQHIPTSKTGSTRYPASLNMEESKNDLSLSYSSLIPNSRIRFSSQMWDSSLRKRDNADQIRAAKQANKKHFLDLKNNPLPTETDEDNNNIDLGPVPVLDDSELKPLDEEGRTPRLKKFKSNTEHLLPGKLVQTEKDNKAAETTANNEKLPATPNMNNNNNNNNNHGNMSLSSQTTSNKKKKVHFRHGVYMRLYKKDKKIQTLPKTPGQNTASDLEDAKEESPPTPPNLTLLNGQLHWIKKSTDSDKVKQNKTRDSNPWDSSSSHFTTPEESDTYKKLKLQLNKEIQGRTEKTTNSPSSSSEITKKRVLSQATKQEKNDDDEDNLLVNIMDCHPLSSSLTERNLDRINTARNDGKIEISEWVRGGSGWVRR
ncbi:hypothetical protein QBC38DRAFT_454348 [Podospora fimiseda]|uniref:Uncharacterized protein n=1 Tax=Podospora fimiseda TaxID=252190 RepID=A0AAN7BRL8_9PEZI|nr:hypothetical protein QBC38DRAFT_454348 [Podospora fimiseda]